MATSGYNGYQKNIQNDRQMCKIKVDREDHFQRPGFRHIIICVFLEYKASNFV